MQYADYAVWQRRVFGGSGSDGVLAGQLDHWAGVLAGLPEELVLPVDRRRGVVASQRGGRVGFRLSEEVHRGLVELAAECGVSVFMVLHAAVVVLLARLGAGTDVPVGTTIAGRGDDVLDEVVGFFVNTLVLRADVSGDPSFRELLARVREVDLAAYAHQDVPFDRLVELVNPARSLARHPLVQVMLSVQDAPEPGHRWPGLHVELEPVTLDEVKFDLTFTFTQQHENGRVPVGIHGEIEYAADLFERGTVERWVGYLVRVLVGVVADPDRPVGRVEVVGRDEWERLVVEWNETGVAYPRDRCVHELFAARVAVAPEATAVVFGGVELSYRELD
ncbi:condensation domain-containing protein, partial [Goodfellowiella coeruleoviolacea]|uniref:condensation domain-containing protein n=1 Tax=Goodfellowiella coeruleoviolacea TaxID=334858 RepID=UPI0027DF37D4